MPKRVNLRKTMWCISRVQVGDSLFVTAIFLTYFHSMHPWFLCALKYYPYLLALALLVMSYVVEPKMRHFPKRYTRVLIAFSLLVCYMLTSRFATYMVEWVIVAALIVCKTELKERFITFTSKFLAVLLAISFSAWVACLLGVNLPSTSGEYLGYHLDNYFFFLNKAPATPIFEIPRFHAVFLEPSHMATTSVLLLFANNLNFKLWYNKVILFMVIASFSLAAYVLLLTALLFKYMRKVSSFFYFVAFIFVVYVAAINYNDGENMVNVLIIERLEVNEDGRLAGDNRVAYDFKADYDRFVKTNKVWLGTYFDEAKYLGGNAGYRVFIFTNGLVGVFLLVLFFLTHASLFKGREVLALLILNAMVFWKGGTPLWYNTLIPILCALPVLLEPSQRQSVKLSEQ